MPGMIEGMSNQQMLMRLLAEWNAFQNGAAQYPFTLDVGGDTATFDAVYCDTLGVGTESLVEDDAAFINDITATADEINVLAEVTAGTVSPSKALVVDANKDLSYLRNLTLGVNGASGVAGSLIVNDGANPGTATTITQADLAMIDGITAGVVSPSKSLVVDANRECGWLLSLTFGVNGVSGLAGGVYVNDGKNPGATLTIGYDELFLIADVTDGTAAPGKALVPDANGDISYINSLTFGVNGVDGSAGGIVVNDGGNPGSTATLTYDDFTVIDGVTPGIVAEGKAVVLDSNFHQDAVCTEELWLGESGTETQVTATADELNVLAEVTAGTVSASKALVVDANKDLGFLRNLTLGVNGASGVAGSLIINNGANPGASTTLTQADLDKIDGITNGTQAAGKAVVADANVNIGTVKCSAFHIGTSGSEVQVTSTAAELNYLAGSYPGGVAYPSTAMVVDANRSIKWLKNLSLGENSTLNGTSAYEGSVTVKEGIDTTGRSVTCGFSDFYTLHDWTVNGVPLASHTHFSAPLSDANFHEWSYPQYRSSVGDGYNSLQVAGISLFLGAPHGVGNCVVSRYDTSGYDSGARIQIDAVILHAFLYDIVAQLDSLMKKLKGAGLITY